MPQKPDLHSGSPRPSGIVGRVFGALKPALFAGIMLFHGLPGAIWQQLTHPNPIRWISPWAWRDAILGNGMGPLLKRGNEEWAPVKGPLIKDAYGRVLEVGAGSGETIEYYDAAKVEHIDGIEPFKDLHPLLKKAIARAGLTSKYTIVPFGIHEREALRDNKILPGSYDTVVLVQVLCSIPNPHEHLAFLQSLLKPGGQLLLFEHVASADSTTQIVQSVITPVWRFIAGGCCLNRHSAEWVRDLGGWESVKIERSVDETAAEVLPMAVGRFVKAK